MHGPGPRGRLHGEGQQAEPEHPLHTASGQKDDKEMFFLNTKVCYKLDDAAGWKLRGRCEALGDRDAVLRLQPEDQGRGHPELSVQEHGDAPGLLESGLARLGARSESAEFRAR